MAGRKSATICGVLRILFGVLLLCLAVTPSARGKNNRGAPAEKFRILYIMSYHSPWRWTDGQLNGFKKGMAGVEAEYRVFQMDTKRNSAVEAKKLAGMRARTLIDSWKPDLVYVSDDDALEYVTKHYRNKDIPFVYSGVNKDPSRYGLQGATNVAGVLEREHFMESVRLLREIVPDVRSIAVIFDTDPMWEPVEARMREAARRLSGVRFTEWSRIGSFAEYRKKMLSLQNKVDAVALIGIFTFKDARGKNVPYQDVLRWTAENSRLPDFSFWIDRVHYGTLCAVNVSEIEQGLAAGRIARAILAEGKSPAGFPVQSTTKGVPVVSVARARLIGLKVKSGLLLSSEVVSNFEWSAK